MGNQLFQQARKHVQLAKSTDAMEKQAAISRAQNSLVSAFANATMAEQRQLSELQSELEQLK